MRTIAVVARDELIKNGVQMALVENDDVASASERKGPYQPFGA